LALFIGIHIRNKFGLAAWDLPLIVLIALFLLCSANEPGDVNICLGAGIGLWISALSNLSEIRQTQALKDLAQTTVI